MVEQGTCNSQVVSSILTGGSIFSEAYLARDRLLCFTQTIDSVAPISFSQLLVEVYEIPIGYTNSSH